MKLTVGSLFSGIGGLELGLERTGHFKTVWQVERDEYALKVLAKHWPDVRRCDDVCDFPAEGEWRCDLICGGFPCQDISYAGKGAGLDGERSGLFYEAIRIIREVGPRYVLLENVAALLTRGIGDVLGTLASIGFDAEWHCIPAASVGAPHIRDRVFVIGHQIQHTDGDNVGQVGASKEQQQTAPTSGSGGRADSLQKEQRPRNKETVADAESERCGQGRTGRTAASSEVREAEGEDVSDTDRARQLQQEGHQQEVGGRAGNVGWWSTEPDVGRVAHGIPARMDRLRCLGNAVVPQVAEYVGNMIWKHHNENR